jgi:RNA polymerase sigma factor (TIGR02999 family)
MQELSLKNPLSSSGPITDCLQLVQEGDAVAREQLFEFLLHKLRRQASVIMRSERVEHTLGASGLVNETCVRMLEQHTVKTSQNRRELFAAASRTMRQILVDHARRRGAAKRGGGGEREFLDIVLQNFAVKNGFEYEQLHEALDALGRVSPRQREVVEHRFFGGLSIEETAELLDVSATTIERDWRLARVKLFALINSY